MEEDSEELIDELRELEMEDEGDGLADTELLSD